MAKKVIDLKANPPKSIPNLTKDAMFQYVKNYGTKDDKVWYVNLCNANTIEKKNNLTNEMGEGLDISKIRKEFAKRFFPNLLEEKKTKSKTKSYMDLVNSLLED
jgi:oligoribonuclease (3'-5' exoribonuclease)